MRDNPGIHPYLEEREVRDEDVVERHLGVDPLGVLLVHAHRLVGDDLMAELVARLRVDAFVKSGTVMGIFKDENVHLTFWPIDGFKAFFLFLRPNLI